MADFLQHRSRRFRLRIKKGSGSLLSSQPIRRSSMYLIMIHSMFGDVQSTVIILHSITQDLDSDLAGVSTSAFISMTGMVGAVGDGAQAGTAARCLSIIPSSLAMDSAEVTGMVIEGE